MRVQLFALLGELHALAGAHEKGAVQFAFEVLYGAGYVGLVVHERFRCLRNAAVFCNIIEYAVIFKADIHIKSPIKL